MRQQTPCQVIVQDTYGAECDTTEGYGKDMRHSLYKDIMKGIMYYLAMQELKKVGPHKMIVISNEMM